MTKVMASLLLVVAPVFAGGPNFAMGQEVVVVVQ